MLQLIDEHQKFNENLSSILQKDWNMGDVGFQYHTVAVFGSQSTGKSTLLNHLFKTEFQVMDDKARRQTTKGIWFNKASDSSILVMDVEGTDGRERGEDQDFERKSALFSIAIAEVIIVNMWETMVGLYNGANMGLLKTVFEVNLQLFGSKDSPRTLLCFVIRDFTSTTQLEALSQTIKEDLNKIWNELRKPKGLEETKFSDFFDLSFNALPHKVYANQQFLESVQVLKKKFFEDSNPNYLFKSQYHRKIPLDGVPHFANSIWDKIVSNKDLDLPSQQQLLSQFRCTEIAKDVESLAEEDLKPVREKITHGSIEEDLGSQLDQLQNRITKIFDEKASRYHQEIYQRIRQELINKLTVTMESLQTKQVKIIEKEAIDDFRTLKLSGNKNVKENYEKLKQFMQSMKKSVAEKLTRTWMQNQESFVEQSLSEFAQEVDPLFDARKEQIIKDFVHVSENEMTAALEEHLGLLFHQINDSLWSDVVSSFKFKLSEQEAKVVKSVAELDLKDTSSVSDAVKKSALEKLLKILHNESAESSLLQKMKNAFEKFFRYEKNGVPKIWTLSDNIEGAFEAARDQSEIVLKAFQQIHLEDLEQVAPLPLDHSSTSLVTPSKAMIIKDRFSKEVEVFYMEAKRSLVVSTAKIPAWFIVLTIVLGWNEFMTILRNPFLFLGLIMTLGTAYFLWSTGLSGPTMIVVKTTGKEMVNQACLKCDELGFPLRNYLRWIPGLETATPSNTATNATSSIDNDQDSVEMNYLKRKD